MPSPSSSTSSTLLKKMSFDIPCDGGSGDDDAPGQQTSLTFDDLLAKPIQDKLFAYKNQISFHYKNKTWDSVKKLTNAFELLVRNPTPVSRSFFKLYEMLSDHASEIRSLLPGAIGISKWRALFLAEGPGGFVEAFHTFRSRHAASAADACEPMYCNTLVNRSNRSVPCWKIPTTEMKAARVRVEFCNGRDGTGNLYSMDNIDSIVADVGGEGAVHIATADGGFDFSDDFSSQESNALQLIVAESYAALRALCVGGTFVLKVFDVSSRHTIAFIQTLARAFERARMTKPMSSRQANSEKYVVLVGYKGPFEGMGVLRRCVVERTVEPLLGVRLGRLFLDGIDRANSAMINAQIQNISRTIAYINVPPGQAALCEITAAQQRRAAAWTEHFFGPRGGGGGGGGERGREKSPAASTTWDDG